MEVIDFISSDKEYKDSAEKTKSFSKVRIRREPRLYITLGTKGRGGRGLGQFHEITEMFIDRDNRLFAGFVLTDRDKSGRCTAYAPFGRLLISTKSEEVQSGNVG